MTIFQSLILGIVQGITEFLPISSSGFLILVPEFFGWPVQTLAFDAFIHLATLAAVLVALWSEVVHIAYSFFNPVTSQNAAWRRLGVWILFSTLPILFVGFFAHDWIEHALRSSQVVAWSFIIWGAVLYLADRQSKQKNDVVTDFSSKHIFLVGLSQVLALIPGTSRSGITITSGLFLGFSRETATRFSFLLGIPAIAAAGLYKFSEILTGTTVISLIPLLVGFVSAFLTALLTIHVLLGFLKRYNFTQIAVFRVLVGFLILLLG